MVVTSVHRDPLFINTEYLLCVRTVLGIGATADEKLLSWGLHFSEEKMRTHK